MSLHPPPGVWTIKKEKKDDQTFAPHRQGKKNQSVVSPAGQEKHRGKANKTQRESK